MECPNCNQCELEPQVVVTDSQDPSDYLGHAQTEETILVCPQCGYECENEEQEEEPVDVGDFY